MTAPDFVLALALSLFGVVSVIVGGILKHHNNQIVDHDKVMNELKVDIAVVIQKLEDLPLRLQCPFSERKEEPCQERKK